MGKYNNNSNNNNNNNKINKLSLSSLKKIKPTVKRQPTISELNYPAQYLHQPKTQCTMRKPRLLLGLKRNSLTSSVNSGQMAVCRSTTAGM